eukprot:6185172-Pleurochrysis_carterae.AAC.2
MCTSSAAAVHGQCARSRLRDWATEQVSQHQLTAINGAPDDATPKVGHFAVAAAAQYARAASV